MPDRDQLQPETDEPVSVVAFPTLDPAALYGLPGKIVQGVGPHTEAHPAAVLLQLLARFGATIGNGPHVLADNRPHPARLNALVVGRTSTGAKGTSWGVIKALFDVFDRPGTTAGASRGPLSAVRRVEPLNVLSGLSSGEGLIEAVRDGNGDNPDAKNSDEGVPDKRLLVVESEFVGLLSVMDRQGSTLPRIVREAWDGETLRTLTRSPLCATDPHIVIIGHCTPGELRLRLKEAQVLGGTLNRFIPVASRRTGLLPDGGNLPDALVVEYGTELHDAVKAAEDAKRVDRSPDADRLWREQYGHLRRGRPDGPVASILARAVPQVLRLSLAYALADRSTVVEREHLAAALALWDYAEHTGEWMFGAHVDTSALDALVVFIASGGPAGRTRTEISVQHYNRKKPAAEITVALSELIKDGRVRQETEESKGGRPATRYFARDGGN